MRKATRLLTALAFGATSFSAMAFSQSPMFSVTILDDLPGGTQAYATGINNTGQVIGVANSSTECPNYCPVIWSNGTPTALGAVAGATSTDPFSINSAGQVAGSAQVNDLSVAVTWVNGTPTILAGPISDATYVNNSCQVVGNGAGGTASIGPATVWNGLTPTMLGLLPGCTHGTPTGINSSGIIVGYLQGGCSEAVVWYGTTPTALPKIVTPGDAEALAVNDLGIVVGRATSPANGGKYTHAVAWAKGVLTDLGTLDASSFATAVNNRGVIVGVSDTDSSTGNHAVLWSRIGAPTRDLNNMISATEASEILLQSAVAINDSCTIVAQGLTKRTKVSEAILLVLNDPAQCKNGL